MPVAITITPGQAHDFTQAEPWLAGIEADAVLADKGHDSGRFVDSLVEGGITPVIPSKANSKAPRDTGFALYRERNLVERFFNRLKTYRGVATRFDKLAETFFFGVLLVCVILGLN